MNTESDPEKLFAMYIALTVRNNMEDFHVKYLTDAQMKELNPLIRDAIYTALHSITEAEHNKWIKKYVDLGYQMIPDYWEPPKLTDDYLYMANGELEKELRSRGWKGPEDSEAS